MSFHTNLSSDVTREEVLKELIDLYPEPVIISDQKGIKFFNEAASKIATADLNGASLTEFLADDLVKDEARLRTHIILKNKIQRTTHHYKINLPNDRFIDVETISGYVELDNQGALFTIIRDVTVTKKELFQAIALQKNMMIREYPNVDALDFEVIYEPSKTISGDFYFHQNLENKMLVGLIGDVCGKGISAAMNISAFEVMYRTIVAKANHPHEIILQLNALANQFFSDRYIATLCYAFDMNTRILRVASAGIGDFIQSDSSGHYRVYHMKGPFLGMFTDLPFDYLEIPIDVGDRFYFYTDGMDPILANSSFFEAIKERKDIHEIRQVLQNEILLEEITMKQLYDDCTIICFEIKG